MTTDQLPIADQAPPRFYKIRAGGPTWFIVAASKRAAWQQWIDWHRLGGYDNDDMGDRPSLSELTADEARLVRIDDDGNKTNLADFPVGVTFCSEY